MTNITLTKQINYVAEDMLLLNRIAEKKTIKWFRESFFNKNTINSPRIQRLLGVVDTILTEMEESLSMYSDEINLYFSTIGSCEFTLADTLVLLSPWDHNEASDTIKDYSLGLEQEEIDRRFLRILNNDLEAKECMSSPSLKEILMTIGSMEVSVEDKWNIQQMYLNREEHINKIVNLMNKAEEIFRKHQYLWQPLIEDYYDFWEGKLEETNPFTDLNNFCQLNIKDVSPLGVIFIPSIAGFNQIAFKISETGPDNNKPDYMMVGVLFGDDFYFNVLKDKTAYEDTALQCLKLLSDRSKLDILSIIKDNRSYGAELAKKLNLTTATISHHMSALMDRRLVKVEKENNRVYFSTNKQIIAELLDYLKLLLVD